MRDEQITTSKAPLYGHEMQNGAALSPGKPEQQSSSATSMPPPAPGLFSSQWGPTRLPYASDLPSLYSSLLPNQGEPDLFDLIHRPQATCVHLPEEDKQFFTSSTDTDYVVLSSIPPERFMSPHQRHLYQSSRLYASNSFPPNTFPPNPSYQIVSNGTLAPKFPPKLPKQASAPSTVQPPRSSIKADPNQDPVRHPHLASVLNEEAISIPSVVSSAAVAAEPSQRFPAASTISSISQLLASPEKNNNIPGSTGAQQIPNRRECAKCGVLFTPILELNGTKQLLCNTCGSTPPAKSATPDVRARASTISCTGYHDQFQ